MKKTCILRPEEYKNFLQMVEDRNPSNQDTQRMLKIIKNLLNQIMELWSDKLNYELQNRNSNDKTVTESIKCYSEEYY